MFRFNPQNNDVTLFELIIRISGIGKGWDGAVPRFFVPVSFVPRDNNAGQSRENLSRSRSPAEFCPGLGPKEHKKCIEKNSSNFYLTITQQHFKWMKLSFSKKQKNLSWRTYKKLHISVFYELLDHNDKVSWFCLDGSYKTFNYCVPCETFAYI